jgi:hypothetical protein
VKTPVELEHWLQAEKAGAAARPHRMSMGAAFVRGRRQAARGGRRVGLAAYVACGCALAAIAAVSWWRAGGLDSATAAAMGACVAWVAGLLFAR